MKDSLDRALDRPDGRIAYDVAGDGPLVIAMPGMADIRSSYRFLVPALVDAGFRVVTMDLRGHGDSDTTFSAYDDAAAASDFVAMVRHLDSGPAVLVGNSMGAGAAALVAAREPDLVSAVVMLGPAVRDLPMSWRTKLMTRLMLQRPWGIAAIAAFYRSLNTGTRPPDLDDHVARIKASLRRPGAWSALVRTTRTSHAEVAARLSDVAAPTLVVMADGDPDFPDPSAEARFIADTLGGPAQVEMVPEAGHYPHAQRPDVVNPAVLDFLAQVQPRA